MTLGTDRSPAALAARRTAPTGGAGATEGGTFAAARIAAELFGAADRVAAWFAVWRMWTNDIEAGLAERLAEAAMFGAAVFAVAADRVAAGCPARRAGIGGA